MIHVLVHFDVRPDRREEFGLAMRELKQNLPEVDGCQAITVLYHKSDPDKYTALELWDSKEKHQSHIAGITQSGDLAKITAMLAGELRADYFVSL